MDATAGRRRSARLGALLHDIGKPRARQPREGAPGEYSFFKHEYVGAEMADAICRRLKLSNAERERVVAHGRATTCSSTRPTGPTARCAASCGAWAATRRCRRLFALREGDVAGRGFGEDPEHELGELRRRIAAVAAEDAAHAGGRPGDRRQATSCACWAFGPSRLIGVVLESLLERVLDDPSLNEREKLEALLPEIAEELKKKN